MKSFFKKLSFVMALAMVVTLAAPAATSALAATEFTYAEQETGKKVTSLNMKVGETVDLKFNGVKDYKNFTLNWKSSNPSVATVDQKGVITAVDNGYATITLEVGDGSVYTSKPVTVTVGQTMNVALGIAKDNTFTAYTLNLGETVDLNFYGVTDWAPGKYNCTWVNSDNNVATVDNKGVVTPVAAGTTTVTVVIVDKATGASLTVSPVTITVPEIKSEDITKVTQKTATKIAVDFGDAHDFDATGVEESSKKTLKVYRIFSTEEMKKMGSQSGIAFREGDDRGYQAYYVMNVAKIDNDSSSWMVEGYTAFVDNATYAVVYGENETNSTANGFSIEFTAHVGKVTRIEIVATDATVGNEVEPAISAELTTKLYNEYGVDLSDYYKNAADTDYELVSDDVEASVSGNEVSFDAPGKAVVKGSYTFYDEEKEEDKTLSAEVTVKASEYSTYSVSRIYKWSLKNGYKSKWSATTDSMIAGDSDMIYVIVEDNRGNYYSNVPGIEGQNYTINGKKVMEIGDGVDNTAFEQYGYELVFDSLDPDSLLVESDGAVESYRKTTSFAVVSFINNNSDNPKPREIGIMAIKVKDARKLASVKYDNGTSFTILAETEAEDDESNFYAGYDDFKTTAELKATFMNQYDKKWDETAVDWDEQETDFTVTTSKHDFDGIAEDIAEALNDGVVYTIDSSMFAGTNTTSVSFKVKERATGDSKTITIKLEKPKYEVDASGIETDVVYVDPSRASLKANAVNVYLETTSTAKLFQVSKANQQVGYFRIDDKEMGDDGHGYYVASDLVKNFNVKAGAATLDFVTRADGTALAVSELQVGDYILVVTDPQGKVFPTVGNGGNGKAFAKSSGLGIVGNAAGTAFEVNVATVTSLGEMEYAAAGSYRAAVYKVTNIAENKNTSGDITSYSFKTSRVASETFSVTKKLKDVTFYHQEKTKDAEGIGAFVTEADVISGIATTMTFRINNKAFEIGTNGCGTYETYEKIPGIDDYVRLPIEIADVDYTLQTDGARAVVASVTFKVYTPAGGYYLSKAKVNRSINAAE